MYVQFNLGDEAGSFFLIIYLLTDIVDRSLLSITVTALRCCVLICFFILSCMRAETINVYENNTISAGFNENRDLYCSKHKNVHLTKNGCLLVIPCFAMHDI